MMEVDRELVEHMANPNNMEAWRIPMPSGSGRTPRTAKR